MMARPIALRPAVTLWAGIFRADAVEIEEAVAIEVTHLRR